MQIHLTLHSTTLYDECDCDCRVYVVLNMPKPLNRWYLLLPIFSTNFHTDKIQGISSLSLNRMLNMHGTHISCFLSHRMIHVSAVFQIPCLCHSHCSRPSAASHTKTTANATYKYFPVVAGSTTQWWITGPYPNLAKLNTEPTKKGYQLHSKIVFSCP